MTTLYVSGRTPPILEVPPDELLRLWTELEEARLGRNGFGGHTAEIYVYRLRGTLSGPVMSAGERQVRAAVRFLAVLGLFAAHHPEVRISIDGRRLGQWLASTTNDHRWHVRIEERHGVALSRKRMAGKGRRDG